MATYFLRTEKKTGVATLYTRVSRPTLGIKSWMVNSGVKVDVQQWRKAERSQKAMLQYLSTDAGKEVQVKMSIIDGVIDDLFTNGEVKGNEDKPILEKAIRDIANEKGKQAREEVESRKREEEENRLSVVLNYYDYFFDSIKNGTLRKKGRVYRDSSVSVWKTFGDHMKGYLNHRHAESMTFDDISRKFADGFVTYLESKDLMAGTVNQNVVCFRRLCNAAAEDEYNKNGSSLRIWHEREIKDEDKRAEIVLTDEEIDELYKMRLKGHFEKVRDVWMLGYLSFQRVSDFSHFTKDNFKVTPNGQPVIAVRQQKTGREVLVPITDDRIMELCEKYDYDFPELGRDAINRTIKAILKELSESVPSLREWNRTLISLREKTKEEWFVNARKRVARGEKLHGEESKRYKRLCEYAEEHSSGDLLWRRDYSGAVIKQRWELVTCHTTRRSSITNMYDSGLYDAKDIMSVSGHTTMQNFERYIKRGAVEQAERIAEIARRAKEIKMRKEA